MATVQPANNFNFAEDGEKLKEEMKGFGTDEQAIIAILTSRSVEQRMAIVKYFMDEYNREILEELKEELGEKFDDLTYALIGTTAEHFGYELNSLLEAENVNERSLIEIACSRTSSEINEIIAQYTKTYDRSLVDHIGNATPARRIASAIINGAKQNKSAEQIIKSESSDELKEVVSIAAQYIQSPVAFYANSLNKAVSEVDQKTITRIIVSRSEIDLAHISKEYESSFNRKLGNDVKTTVSDDYKIALCGFVGTE